MRCLGLDIGDRWIGVALSDPGGILASPFSIIERIDDAQSIAAIADIIDKEQVEIIVVGLPLSLDGTLSGQAEKVKEFTDKLSEHIKTPMEFRDERLTTVMAQRLKRASGGKKVRGKTRYDSQAAAIILQSYLDEGR